MRPFFRPALLAALLLTPLSGQAQQAQPRRLGDFQSWTAAAIGQGAQKVCYAFTRAGRQGPMLTVTHRNGSRDEVTIAGGHAYPRNAPDVKVAVGQTSLDFYTADRTAAARDGTAAVRAFRNGRDAVAKGPGPHGRGESTETFPLAGFGAAYDAISRECPARR
ncbi:hypothetical protein JYK14_18935 [Siccirubricoccus sp. KC 17139]|uniref:Mlr4354 like protein n=1 Tax=Siccirubricoccus soli TaxID=2899147 RepID=A0ABT1D8H0_9PROT|nr:hypothetical protein [Siccirubricoccus soli]MCO6418223.1 hypothetical protein [Siccirubricoccus soli]MCP2684358.1 hypothetical protein [Siccirubricoccus soli]